MDSVTPGLEFKVKVMSPLVVAAMIAQCDRDLTRLDWYVLTNSKKFGKYTAPQTGCLGCFIKLCGGDLDDVLRNTMRGLYAVHSIRLYEPGEDCRRCRRIP